MRPVLAISILLAASSAAAQPGVGITKTAPLTGNGNVASPLRIAGCSLNEILKWNGSLWACAADGGGGGITDGDKGDITVSLGGLTWTIDNNVVDFAKMADLATARVIGRVTAGTGDPEALTAAQVTANFCDLFSTSSTTKGCVPGSNGGGSSVFLNGSGTYTVPAGGGDVTDVSTTSPMAINTTQGGTCTSGNCTVALRAANTNRIFGRVTAGAGNAEELTGTQATTVLDVATTALKGLVPATGGGTTNFLRADMTFAAPPGAVSSVTAGAGLTGGGTGAVNLDVGAGAGITVAANAVSLTLCAADRSLVMDGAGTTWGCYTPVTGVGTQHYVARWSNAGGTALSTGQIFDDTTNEVKVGAGADAASRVDARFLVTENGDTGAYVRDSTSNQEIGIWTGGGGGFIGTSTAHDLFLARSASAKLGLVGAGVELYDNTSITGTLAVSGTTTFNGTANTVGDADTDYLNARGTLAVSGANVSTASANCTATGEAQSFTFSRSSGGSASCVIDLNRTFNSAPYCVVTSSSNKVATYYVSAISTTQVTITSSDSIDAYVWCPDRR